MGELEPGSLAEWVSAVGTVGALLIAIVLWRKDERARQRQYIDQVEMSVYSDTTQSTIISIKSSYRRTLGVVPYLSIPKGFFKLRYRMMIPRVTESQYVALEQLPRYHTLKIEEFIRYDDEDETNLYIKAPARAYLRLYDIFFELIDRRDNSWFFRVDRNGRVKPASRWRGRFMFSSWPFLNYLRGNESPPKKEIPAHVRDQDGDSEAT